MNLIFLKLSEQSIGNIAWFDHILFDYMFFYVRNLGRNFKKRREEKRREAIHQIS